MSLKKYNDELCIKAKNRKIEYNKNPHICKFCGNPILMKESDRYNEIYIKKFCSRNCSSQYGHIIAPRTGMSKGTFLDNFTDEDIIKIFNSSKNYSEFSKKLGYSNRISDKQTAILNRIKNIGINVDDLKHKNDIFILDLSKKELFSRYTGWQNARSQIQKYARNVYENSNKPKCCIICGYNKHYEVAHIKAVSEFSDETLIAEIDNINNLIALCPNHHREYDNNVLYMQTYLDKIQQCNILSV